MSDRYPIRGRLWPSKPDCPVGIMYLHGIQSHGGWYEWSASLLAETGALVIAPDRRGSGLNEQSRGDTPDAARWFADLDELATECERTFGIQRWSVVGVSWGGKLAAAWRSGSFNRGSPGSPPSSRLLIAPGLFPRVDIGLSGRIKIGWSMLKDPLRPIDLPLDDPALFTGNVAGRAFIASDSLKLDWVTARFLYHSHQIDRALIQDNERSRGAALSAILAENDQIIRNSSTERWLRHVGVPAQHIEYFEKGAHTIEFEADPTQFAQALRRWRDDEVASPRQ